MSLLFVVVLGGVLSSGTFTYTAVSDSVSVADFGVHGDGRTEQSDTLQYILNTYSHVYFPPGKYVIKKSLALRDQHHISGGDSTVFVFREVPGQQSPLSFFTILGARNIRIKRLTFYADDRPERTAFAIAARNVHRLTLEQVKAYNCGLATIRERKARPHTYASVPDDLDSEKFLQAGNSHVTITRCQGEGSKRSMAEHTAGVLISYTNHWKVAHSTFTRYSQGVQWWGGDSDTKRDGRLANTRKCQNGIVSEVKVSHVRGGGIWGSMGKDITVENCQVSHCGDVGIDFEGCFQSQAINNYVAESNNGNLAVFHHNQKILFSNNQSVQSKPGRIQACIYNASQSRDNGQVTFDDNVFINIRGIGHIKQQGPSNRIVFTKNSLHDVVVNFRFNNNQHVLVQENMFLITRPLDDFNYVISAGQTHFGGEVLVEDNQILSTVAQNSSVFAISLYQSDYNSSPTNRISNNYVVGLPRQVKTEWAGTNAGRIAKTYIQSSQPLSPEAVKKIDSGARSSKLYVNDREWR